MAIDNCFRFYLRSLNRALMRVSQTYVLSSASGAPGLSPLKVKKNHSYFNKKNGAFFRLAIPDF